MAKESYKITINTGVKTAKDIIEKLMVEMGFEVNYKTPLEMIATRGSVLAKTLVGPLAGKKGVSVKFKLIFQSESDNTTTVILSDAALGAGKALTWTGGTTARTLMDVYAALIEGIRREGLH